VHYCLAQVDVRVQGRGAFIALLYIAFHERVDFTEQILRLNLKAT